MVHATGGVGHTMFASFSAACLVAGGSGISFALGMLEELVAADEAGASNLTSIELIWSVPDPRALTPFLPQLESLLARTRTASVRVSVFYTRALQDAQMRMYLPPAVSIAAGRPRMPSVLDALLTRTITAGRGGAMMSGAVVGVCGPPAMGAEVAAAVNGVNAHLRRSVGGVELHTECVFSFWVFGCGLGLIGLEQDVWGLNQPILNAVRLGPLGATHRLPACRPAATRWREGRLQLSRAVRCSCFVPFLIHTRVAYLLVCTPARPGSARVLFCTGLLACFLVVSSVYLYCCSHNCVRSCGFCSALRFGCVDYGAPRAISGRCGKRDSGKPENAGAACLLRPPRQLS